MSTHTVSIAAPAAPHRPSRLRTFFSMENRFIPPMFITGILLVAHFSFGVLESWTKTLTAIACSIACELLWGKLLYGRYPHLASAYISGISVGILLRSPAWWPYAVCAAIATTSKYVLRYKGRHIWNPSNFAICVMLVLAHEAVTTLSIQWGNNLAAMAVIWLLGSLIIARLKRFHITLTYVACFLLFAVWRAHIVHDPVLSEISPITGPEYQLFIFFMITDPKTTVRSKRGQMMVALAVAAVEMVLRLNNSIYAPLYALFIVGPIALLIEMNLTARKQRPAAAVLGAPAAVAAN